MGTPHRKPNALRALIVSGMTTDTWTLTTDIARAAGVDVQTASSVLLNMLRRQLGARELRPGPPGRARVWAWRLLVADACNTTRDASDNRFHDAGLRELLATLDTITRTRLAQPPALEAQ